MAQAIRNAIRANRSARIIRNHLIRANRANRFTPLSSHLWKRGKHINRLSGPGEIGTPYREIGDYEIQGIANLTMMRCAKGIFAKGIWGCTGFSLLRWEKGFETASCGGEKGLRLPRSSCSDLGNEGVSDPFPHRKRESQTLFPTAKGKNPVHPLNPLSENPLNSGHRRLSLLYL